MTIPVIVGLAVAGWAVFTFNRFIWLRRLGDNAWADIDVQLKRRHDLIPNVVAVVKGHASYEKGTLEAVVEARGRAVQASQAGPATRAREEDPLGAALQRVLVVAESYPELKAAASFASLQSALIELEDHLQNARRYYNAVVRDFNTAIAQFPRNLIARVMRLEPREFFGLEGASERAVPRISLALFLALAVATPLTAQRSYSIERFDARIRVNQDASIDVTETITARFVGSWNGLYRTIPIKYRTAQGLNWTLGLSLGGARDLATGQNLRTETSRQGHYAKYKIWIPGATDAQRTIVVRYHATNGLRFFDEHDELYWNVTGDEWDVPLQAASAAIELPPGTAGMRATAFNGVYGSTARDARVTIDGNVVRVAMPHPLGYHEGLTVVVGWDKGVVTAPTLVSSAAEVARSNWPLVIPLVVLVLAFLAWRRWGRDPRRRPVAVQYEPPPGMTPAEAGTLLDNQADMRDVTATLVDLAVKGQLRIEERESPKLFGLFGGGAEYALHRLTPADANGRLAPHESSVLSGIFAGHSEVVELSDLKNEFYTKLPAIRDAIFDRLKESGYYRDRPDRTKRKWIGIAIAGGMLIGLGGTYLSSLFLLTPVPFIIAGVISAIILMIFAQVMPARTESGTRALEQVLGFEEFLRRVEAEHLKRIIIGHPELFDKYLPFALAFGVARQFTRAFEGIYTEPPRWYVGANVGAFNVTHFSNSISHMSSVAGSTLASQPRSSSGSGFGGGGSSGGGGGGGGGGAF